MAVIDFSRALTTAWERMIVILFQPFDAVKWFVIGFSAFLAGLASGGNGFNFNFNFNGRFNPNDFKNGNFHVTTNTSGNTQQLQQLNEQFRHFFTSWSFGLILCVAVLVFVLVIGLGLLIVWLGARGQFMFLDNIVRNRGAVQWPWQRYARLANDFFFLYVVLEFVVLLFIVPILVLAVILLIPLFREQRWPHGGEILELTALGLAYFAVAIVAAIILFIYREIGVPIMFRQGISARAAFAETFTLVTRAPGNIAIFLLLRIVLAIGMAVISIILFCVTCLACCLSQWPYFGTLMLLPALVFLKCFTLDVLAQLGPQYDVFTVDVPPAGAPGSTPLIPPPQPG
jgi:hypothetical protein